MSAVAQTFAIVAAIGGVGLLRLAWRRARPAGLTFAAWALLAAAAPALALAMGWDKAVALAVVAPCLAALAVVAAGRRRREAVGGGPRPARQPRHPRQTTELPDKSGEALWRTLLRTVFGGPLCGAAALLVSADWAVKGVGPQSDRLALALLAAPALWALGLVWSTTDPRLGRIGVGLCTIVAAALAAAL